MNQPGDVAVLADSLDPPDLRILVVRSDRELETPPLRELGSCGGRGSSPATTAAVLALVGPAPTTSSAGSASLTSAGIVGSVVAISKCWLIA